MSADVPDVSCLTPLMVVRHYSIFKNFWIRYLYLRQLRKISSLSYLNLWFFWAKIILSYLKPNFFIFHLSSSQIILFEAKFFHISSSQIFSSFIKPNFFIFHHSFKNLSVFNTQKSFKISLRQMFISKLTILDENICNYATFLSAVFWAKVLIFSIFLQFGVS